MKEDPIPVGARLHRSLRGSAPRSRAHTPQLVALGLRPSDSTEVARPEPGHRTCLASTPTKTAVRQAQRVRP